MMTDDAVYFVEQDPHGGEMTVTLDKELFGVVLTQARDMAQMRRLFLAMCERETANAVQKREKKAMKAGAK